MATATSIQYVQKMFIAYLGRGASTEALTYWADEIDEKGEAGKDALFFSLYQSDEGKALYDGKTQDQVIEQIFQNAFERSAQEAGKTYYKAELDSGELNLVSMAGAIVDSADTAGQQVFDYKNEAADYYRTEIDGSAEAVFQPSESKTAVDSVDGPNSLQDSKDVTDAIASGVGTSAALTVGNDTVTMSGGDDVVTGTNLTMGGSGTNIDSIVDGSTTDADSLTLTADKTIEFGTVTNVETIDVSLSAVNGTSFALTGGATVTGSSTTINFTAAPTVDLGGATIAGEQSISLDSQAVDVTTTSVTDYTATAVTNDGVSITGDASLTAVTVTGGSTANDSVTVTLADNDSTVTVDLDGGAGDSLTLNADGKVALGANDVETVNIAGISEELAVSMGLTVGAKDFNVSGTQDVTINAANDVLNGTTITNTGSGTVSLGIETAAGNSTVDLTSAGDLAGIAVNSDLLDKAIVMGGNTVTLFNTANAIEIESNDATDGSLDLVVNGTTAITEDGFEDIDITSNDSVLTNITLTTSGVAGTGNDVDIDLSTGNDTTITVNSTGTAAVDFTSGTSGEVTLGANSLISTGASGNVDFSVTATNDISGGSVTATSNDAAANVELTSTSNDVDADVRLDESTDTSPVSLVVTAAGDATMAVTLTGGGANSSVSITAGEDVTVAGGIDASAINGVGSGTTDITIEATANDVGIGSIISNDGDITITAGDQITGTGVINAGSGAIVLTNAGALGVSEVAGAVTGGSVTIAAGNDIDFKTVGVTGDAIVVSGAGDVDLNNAEAYVLNSTGSTGNLTAIFSNDHGSAATTVSTGSGNDILTFNKATVDFDVTTGAGIDTVTITTAETGSTFLTGDGADIVDHNQASTDIITINTGDDNDTITIVDQAANDIILTGGGTNTVVLEGFMNDSSITGGGTDTLKLATGANVAYNTLTLSGIDTVDITAGDATMSAATFGSDNTFTLIDTANGDDEVLHLIAAATGSTIDASNILFSIDQKAKVAATGGDGNDTLTGSTRATTINAGDGADIVEGGGAIDIIDGGDGEDVIDGNGGADIIGGGAANDTITGGEGADVITGGGGVDSIILSESVASADDVAVDDDAAGNHSVITGWGTGDQIAINESEFATIAFAGTAAVADLHADDYNEIAAGGTLAADHVNVITTAAGYASYDAAFAAVTGAAGEMFILFYNSTTGKTELYFDADGSNGAGEILIAQIDIAGAAVVDLSEAAFTVF